MKKFLSIVAMATIFCATSFAQENGNRDAEGNIVRGPYEPNGFWDNTFVELEGGVQFIGSCHMGRNNGASSIMPGLAIGANVGKWFNPNFGLRLGWQGINGQYKPGTMISDGEYIRKYNTNYAHADFLVNISNWFSGYKETRFWDVVPYIHAGYINFKRTDIEAQGDGKFASGVGLYNKFRITDRVGLSLDLRGVITDNYILGGDLGYSVEENYAKQDFTQRAGGYVAALVGIHVNLGKTGWKRVGAVAEAPEFICSPDQAMLDDRAVVLASQDKADEAVNAAIAQQNAAAEAYTNALKDVDVYGRVTTAPYESLGVDVATAAAFAIIANNEDCPDFASLTKAEDKEWYQNHKAILPEGWNKLSATDKTQWVEDNIFAPAEKASAVLAAAEKDLIAANNAVLEACNQCNETVGVCQELVDRTSKKVDANGNVLPACYPDVDEALAQKYCDFINTEECPDFTAMSNKEIRQWTKAHKDILPADWKKMNSVQKNQWINSTIVCPATLAKEQNAFAEQELEKAKARKISADEFYKNCLKPIVPTGSAPKIGDAESVGFFTIGRSIFNDKQMANWKKTLQGMDKRCDYVVTGYADKETGTPSINARLRQERSEYVKGLLQKEGFTGVIVARPAAEGEKYVNSPIWKNRSAVVR